MSSLQRAFQALSFDGQAFCILAGIVTSVMLASSLMQNHKPAIVYVDPVGTSFLQKEGIQ